MQQHSELRHFPLVIRFFQVRPVLSQLPQRSSQYTQAVAFSVTSGVIWKCENEIAKSFEVHEARQMHTFVMERMRGV